MRVTAIFQPVTIAGPGFLSMSGQCLRRCYAQLLLAISLFIRIRESFCLNVLYRVSVTFWNDLSSTEV